jgi:hypothetical protein
MSKTAARPLATFLGVVTISLLGAAPLAARSLDALQSPDPARETAAPADAGFAASCRAASRELLGKGSFNFERPAYASRDGQGIVRMDVTVPGLARDGTGLFRAVCVRDPRTGGVEAAIFDAPADDIGPRVIALRGPEGGAAPAPGHVIAFNPSGPAADPGYGGFYGGTFPALAVPFCANCVPVIVRKPVRRTAAPDTFSAAPGQSAFPSGPTFDPLPGIHVRSFPPSIKAPRARIGGVRIGRPGFGR